MENENRKLHEWFGLGCYHRWKREVEGAVAEADNVCVDCGQPHTDYSYGGWGVDKSHTRPRYDEESGFFALLSGLAERGYRVTTRFDSGDVRATATIWIPNEEGDQLTENADTLPLALFNASLKALENEG